MTQETPIEQLAINAIRFLAADAVEAAKSGHPGMPMGAAPMAYVLWRDFLKHNPANPEWPDRDRFVLSAGHGSMLLYALLHLTGYDLPLEELKRFRQWGSKTPGHPEYGHTPGVEVTTGPLGSGISTAVGLALAELKLAAEFNRDGFEIVDHYTYVIASDGDLMEGISSEASSLAGHWKLGKLIVLWDDNHISIDGTTKVAFSEDVLGRYKAYGWQTLFVEDGNDTGEIRAAIEVARANASQPTIIAVRTHIGYGSPKQDSPDAHGAPLGEEALAAARERLGWPYPPFEIPDEVYQHFRRALDKGMAAQESWEKLFEAYAWEYPELGGEFTRRVVQKVLPSGWREKLPEFEPGQKIATRKASGQVLAALSPVIPELLGGSADLTPSNNTKAPDMTDFSPDNPTGRYIHYGVREHAMGAILNGLVLHGGYRPYGGTFLVFSDYMRGAVRLAAMMGIPTVYVWTHDSIAIGEDGPTHQPIEHLMSLRAMPDLWVIRPADATETAIAWRMALERADGPTALILTRQGLPVLDRQKYAPADGVLKGGYVLSEPEEEPVAVIVATGSEVALALEAQELLASEGVAVRVVSLPCFEALEAQEESYRQRVLPPGLPTLAVEAGATLGWERYADAVLGVDRFGASAPGPVVYREYGFTPENVAAKLKELLER
ncbi:transketolase [Oceanithermus sp.]